MLKQFCPGLNYQRYRGLSTDSIPDEGETVYLKTTANLSQGGTATDVTDEVNPDIRLMAERAARIIGLDCVGVDALANDISLPLGQSGTKGVEVNAAPGFRMHLEPTNGQPRNVSKPLVDMHFPEGYAQIPVLALTGTKRNAIIRKSELDITVCTLEEIPITFGGIIDFNISNALAAIGVLHGLKLPLEQNKAVDYLFFKGGNRRPAGHSTR